MANVILLRFPHQATVGRENPTGDIYIIFAAPYIPWYDVHSYLEVIYALESNRAGRFDDYVRSEEPSCGGNYYSLYH